MQKGGAVAVSFDVGEYPALLVGRAWIVVGPNEPQAAHPVLVNERSHCVIKGPWVHAATLSLRRLGGTPSSFVRLDQVNNHGGDPTLPSSGGASASLLLMTLYAEAAPRAVRAGA